MKKPPHNEKYKLEKSYTKEYEAELDVKGSFSWDSFRPWDTGKNDVYGSLKEDWVSSYDYGNFKPGPTDVYNIAQDEADAIAKEWSGALVRFNTRYYNRGLSVFTGYNVTPAHAGPTASRISDDDYDYLKHTGTVITVDRNPNYKRQWCVSIMWSDGMLSYENVLDLQIIQPGI